MAAGRRGRRVRARRVSARRLASATTRRPTPPMEARRAKVLRLSRVAPRRPWWMAAGAVGRCVMPSAASIRARRLAPARTRLLQAAAPRATACRHRRVSLARASHRSPLAEAVEVAAAHRLPRPRRQPPLPASLSVRWSACRLSPLRASFSGSAGAPRGLPPRPVVRWKLLRFSCLQCIVNVCTGTVLNIWIGISQM